ncbi:hypothetical protein AB0368_30825 [Actinoplanes sp. NPDC051475]|uniref:hypothetical protein n=1 Tax=Actinoplanes sp. NPDC051475 TaxID=3157225 RepID=UPI00344C144B
MTASGEHVLWSHYADSPPTGRSRSLLVGAALLTVALLGVAWRIRSPRLAPFFGLALIAGTGLLLLHLLKSRRREISRVWTDSGRPGVLLMRRAGGAVQTLDPARVRRIFLVHTSGSYRDERPGEPGESHSYVLTRVTLRAGLTWYTTPNQPLPDSEPGDAGREQPSRPETRRRLVATFPNARLSQRHLRRSQRESTE